MPHTFYCFCRASAKSAGWHLRNSPIVARFAVTNYGGNESKSLKQCKNGVSDTDNDRHFKPLHARLIFGTGVASLKCDSFSRFISRICAFGITVDFVVTGSMITTRLAVRFPRERINILRRALHTLNTLHLNTIGKSTYFYRNGLTDQFHACYWSFKAGSCVVERTKPRNDKDFGDGGSEYPKDLITNCLECLTRNQGNGDQGFYARRLR